MTADYDPYHRWLGIAPDEQPADHYRLLGVSHGEGDPEVIRDAAERQIRHVRSYELGEQAELAQKILNELARAKACLLDSTSKAKYDESLRKTEAPTDVVAPAKEPLQARPLQKAKPLPVATPAVAPSPAAESKSPIVVTPAFPSSSRSAKRSKTHSSSIPKNVIKIVLGGVAGLVVATLFLWYVFGRDPSGVASRKPHASQASTEKAKRASPTASPNPPVRVNNEPQPSQTRTPHASQASTEKAKRPSPTASPNPPVRVNNEPQPSQKASSDNTAVGAPEVRITLRKKIRGHTDNVKYLAYSPNGDMLASVAGSGDMTVKLWRMPDGEQIAMMRGHTKSIRVAAFSPDGNTLATGAENGGNGSAIRLWDIQKRTELAVIEKAHTHHIVSLSFSADGKLLASSAYNRTHKIWDVSSLTLVAERSNENKHALVAFSPVGNLLVAGDEDGTIKLWDRHDSDVDRQLHSTGPTGRIYRVAFSPSGRVLAAGFHHITPGEVDSEIFGIRLWDTRTGEEISVLRGHKGRVRSISFSPNGTKLISGGVDKILVWEIETGAVIGSVPQRNTDQVLVSPDGQTLVRGYSGHDFELWDIESDGFGQRTTFADGGLGVDDKIVEESGTEETTSTAESASPAWKTIGRATQKEAEAKPAVGGGIGILRGHSNVVRRVVFSPDSRLLASASYDHTLRLWDVSTGREVATLAGHSSNVHGVAFSPNGRLLASTSSDDTVKLWDVVAGEETATLRGHKNHVWDVAFRPDGRQLATASSDRTVKLWDIAVGQETATFKNHQVRVNCLAYSPNGQRLVSADGNGSIRLWNLDTGSEIGSFEGDNNSVVSVCFSPDGRLLASATEKTVRLWDVASRQLIGSIEGYTFRIRSVTFSPDGQLLATGAGEGGSSPGGMKLWDVETGEEVKNFEGNTHDVFSVAFSPDGRWLASGSADNTVKLWDRDTGTLKGYAHGYKSVALKGHGDSVTSVAFSPNGRQVASASRDNTVKLWSVENGQETAVLKGHSGYVSSVTFSPNGRRIASASFDRTIKLWDVRKGRETATLEGHESVVQSVVFSPDGRLLASGGGDGVRLWDVPSNGKNRLLGQQTSGVTCVTFSPNGEMLASASASSVTLWNVITGQQIATLEGHTDGILHLAFSPDGLQLASASDDKTVKLWDVSAKKEIATLEGHLFPVFGVAFNADGRRLVTGGGKADEPGELKLWSVETGQEIEKLWGHVGAVHDVVFSADGRWLASAGADKTVKLWDFGGGRIDKQRPLVQPTRRARPPVPSQALQTEALTNVKKQFEKKFSEARTPDDQIAIARQLLQIGSDTANDDTGRYVLFRVARDIAIKAGDVDVANRAIDLMDEHYEIDALNMKTSVFAKRTKQTVHQDERAELAESMFELANEAIRRERYEIASQLLDVGLSNSRRARTIEITKQIVLRKKEIRPQQQAHAKYESAVAVLNESPEEPTANLEAGCYLCFAKGNWEQGLPMLAKGGIQSLQQVAQLELSAADDPAAQLELAEAWLVAAGELDGLFEVPAKTRAMRWYQRALPGLSGLAKVRCEERVTELENLGVTLDENAGLEASPPDLPSVSARTSPSKPEVGRKVKREHNRANLAPIRAQSTTLEKAHFNQIDCLAFSPDGKILASGGRDFLIKLWNMSTGQAQVLEAHSDSVHRIAFSLDGKLIASASGSDMITTINVWDASTGVLHKTFTVERTAPNWIEFSPDASHLAIGSGFKDIRICDLETGVLKTSFRPLSRGVDNVAFAPNGKIIASASGDQKIKIWNVATGQLRHELSGFYTLPSRNNVLAFNEDGTLLTAIGFGYDERVDHWYGEIRVWDVFSGEQKKLSKLDSGDLDGSDVLVVSSSGELVATYGRRDGSIKLWDGLSGVQLSVLQAPTNGIIVMAFSPDGTMLAGTDHRGTITIWRLFR